MKPFILIGTRADDAIADAEYRAFLRHGGLQPHELRRIRLEAAPLPAIDLDEISGVIVGGSPFNASDPDDLKSAVQRRVEADLAALLDELVARDFPFFGACYGVGTLGVHRGGTIDRGFGEAIGAVTVEVTEEGARDALFGGLPRSFTAYVGHKEACRTLPPGAILLATGSACPIQAFRVGSNLYATQFHPELDADDLIERVRAYRHEGYFAPEDVEATVAAVRSAPAVHEPAALVRRFVERYRTE